jgi:hypothetical protein
LFSTQIPLIELRSNKESDLFKLVGLGIMFIVVLVMVFRLLLQEKIKYNIQKYNIKFFLIMIL